MSTQNTAFAYQQFAAFGASPVDQVVALYDRILRDFHRAIAAIAEGKTEERVNASNHALTIIGELQGVLDFERGGEVAGNLNNFYDVTRPMVVQASMMSSRERFEELIAMYSRMRAAWARVARIVPASQPGERPRISSPSPAQPSGNSSAAQRDPQTTSTGRWNA